ncbi:hypothetical protein [Paenibacillus donghaensis]|uniref:Uncharacterized protein n=1 Tax=Paenibacillus donghaensis TaxID=414771 RepID=A0A2Z2KTB5_9BACL|nr:hypothetical protein [Paenibacillus donghaensis]ASA22618.1 hypothetical protein B9T62_18600 [Paenibacillus donghaensis]
MDVGHGCYISDKWIPIGLPTGIYDVEGNHLETSNKVRLNGCGSKYAFVGKSMQDKFGLYFGSEHGSVLWYLDEETIQKHKVRLCEE